jgi:hypothetical protein
VYLGLPAALTILLVNQPAPAVSFEQAPGTLRIEVHNKPFATYVWNDPIIRRPFFSHVHTPSGAQVTRTHPPVEGKDATDHATMHPGLWMAFGDLSGADFWRNHADVTHVAFVEPPRVTQTTGHFAVKNHYIADGRLICEEVCRITVRPAPEGTWIDWSSEFSAPDEFTFGDQEEMGLGIRVATPWTVTHGGRIRDSEGRTNEREVWGKQADWCDYSNTINGRSMGVLIVPHPGNFRRSWFHARDYGLLVANPFGRKAFRQAQESMVTVKPGETFRLRFAVLIHAGELDVKAAAQSAFDKP